MLNNNWSTGFRLIMKSINGNLKDINGVNRNVAGNDLRIALADNNTANWHYVRLYPGGDDTPPTKDDYKLGTSLHNNLQFTDCYVAFADGVYAYNVSQVYANISNEAVTIKEIGLMYRNYVTNTNQDYTYMLGRIVLDEPVVMQPGDVYSFSYTIK